MSNGSVRYGLTTTVLGDRFKTRYANLPRDVTDAWWERTDYGWVCTACPNIAGMNWPTSGEAQKDAEQHAATHDGATIEAAR